MTPDHTSRRRFSSNSWSKNPGAGHNSSANAAGANTPPPMNSATRNKSPRLARRRAVARIRAGIRTDRWAIGKDAVAESRPDKPDVRLRRDPAFKTMRQPGAKWPGLCENTEAPKSCKTNLRTPSLFARRHSPRSISGTLNANSHLAKSALTRFFTATAESGHWHFCDAQCWNNHQMQPLPVSSKQINGRG